MNEHAWKEQAARIIDPASWAVMDSYLKQMLRKYKGKHIGYDPEAFKHKESMAIAEALWPLVQQAIAAERGEPVAVPHVVYDMKMPPYHYQKPYTGSGGSISVPATPALTEAQIRADERERCAKVAERYVGSTPPRYKSGIERRATTSQQADNYINAMKVRAADIAAAIRSLKESDNGAG